jgi:phosphatidate cytidylyltransferase
MLLHRVLTAAVAIAILVPVLLFGGVWGFALIAAAVIGLAAWELATVLPTVAASPCRELTIGLTLLIVFAFAAVPSEGAMAIMAAIPFVVLVLHLVLYHRVENTVSSAAEMAFVLGYVAVPLAHVMLLRQLPMGITWVIFVFLVICIGDAGAFFAGKYRGKRPLAPAISPSKTIEGLLGGIAGNIAAALAVKALVPGLTSWPTLAVLTLALAMVGPVGDLCASALKRKLGIKDYGSIMPGHGGLMDRADSLIMAFPVGYYGVLFTPW